MKTSFFLQLLLFLSSLSFAQNLTLSELFAISNKSNWDEVNEYMSNKGWDYYESSKGYVTHCSTINWAFKKEDWICLSYCATCTGHVVPVKTGVIIKYIDNENQLPKSLVNKLK